MKPVFAVFVLLTSALGQTGKDVYAKKCRSCHGDGSGNPAIAKSLKVTLRHLGSKDVQAKSDAQLKKETTGGIGKMKAVKLTPEQTNAVVGFLRTLKQ